MKKRTFIVVFLVVGLLLGVGGAQAFALSLPEERTTPIATVTVDEGEAYVGTGQSWRPVAADAVVTAGDHVKTEAKSQATINFFDGASARLDESTEVSVSAVMLDPDNHTRTQITLGVVAGRVWSRVVKLLDTDASYQVETSSMVATVRGTAFVADVRDAEGDVIQVESGSVGVAVREQADPNNAEAWQVVNSGEEAWGAKARDRREKEGMRRRSMPDGVGNSAWFKKMRAADEAFLAHVEELRRRTLMTAARVLPGSPQYPLRRLGESVRIALTTDATARQDLQMRYANRRFAEAMLLGRAGKQTASTRAWRTYLGEMRTMDTDFSGDAARGPALRLRLMGRMMESRALVVPLVSGKDSLPGYLERELADEAEFGQMIFRLRAMRQPLGEVLDRLRTEAAAEPQPLVDPTTGQPQPPGGTPTNTNTNTNTNQPSEAVPVSLAVVATRTIMNLPDTQQLRAVLTMSDDSTRDVTNEAVWAVTGDPPIGTVSRGFFTSASVGTGTVSATHSGRSGSVALRVLAAQPAPVELTALTVSPATTSLQPGAAITFRATARYSDGTTRDVTGQAEWSVSVPQLGTVNAGLLTTTINSYGTGTITARFTDQGVSFAAGATVYVGSPG